jgi:hypothetical protein
MACDFAGFLTGAVMRSSEIFAIVVVVVFMVTIGGVTLSKIV